MLWPPDTPTQYEAAASSSLGTYQSYEKQLQDLLATTTAQHWNAVGICYGLLINSPPSMQNVAMEVLENLSVSFVRQEQTLLDCITVVRDAAAEQQPQEASTSPSGKTP